jgi:predicted MFS family arabinose efflux permease
LSVIGLTSEPQQVTLSRRVILVLAVACGVCVANVYYAQPISPLFAAEFHISKSAAAIVPTASQLGYAAGLFLLVPLGDRVRSRPLIMIMLALTTAGLVVAGTASGLAVLTLAVAAVGITTVVPQILLPMAAGMVEEERRGAVSGMLLSGLLGGILLARTFSATLGGWLGWRAPFLISAGLILVLAAVLFRLLPDSVPTSQQHYGALLAAPLRLLAAEPALRRSCLNQALMFGAFSAAWTTVALLLTGPAFGLSTQAVGVLALVGAGSVLSTPFAGRRIDRDGPELITLVCFAGVLASAAVLLLADLHGAAGLILLGAGMLLLDTFAQCSQVANQARVFALAGQARARANTAYMTSVFIGGSIGSWLGVRVYDGLGWPGIAGLVGVAALVALARHGFYLWGRVRRQPEPAPGEPGVPR